MHLDDQWFEPSFLKTKCVDCLVQQAVIEVEVRGRLACDVQAGGVGELNGALVAVTPVGDVDARGNARMSDVGRLKEVVVIVFADVSASDVGGWVEGRACCDCEAVVAVEVTDEPICSSA